MIVVGLGFTPVKFAAPVDAATYQSDMPSPSIQATTVSLTQRRESLCDHIGAEPDCSLPANLEHELQASLENSSSVANNAPTLAFAADLTATGGNIAQNYVDLGEALTYEAMVSNRSYITQTVTFSHTLNHHHGGYAEPALVCIQTACGPRPGFTTGNQIEFMSESRGGYWTASYTTQAVSTGFYPVKTYLTDDFNQNQLRVSGVWALNMNITVSENTISLNNPNASLNGGNYFFYEVESPSGVQVTGATDNERTAVPEIWNGQTELYLGPGEDEVISATLSAEEAGTYDITVRAYAPEFEWEGNDATVLRGAKIFTETVTVEVPQEPTEKKPLVSIEPDFTEVLESSNEMVWVTIKREGNLTVPFTVTLDVGGNAIADMDYRIETSSVVSGTQVVSFQPDQTELQISLSMIDDDIVEGSEAINLLLQQNPDISIQGKGRATITILDNDANTNPPSLVKVYLPLVVR
ncbi:MAG: Calx-beta domain-containing protein [Patescibacteria group bacterium]